MATFTAWIELDLTGARCEDEFEIPDEELEGLTPGQREERICAEAREVAFEHISWGYETKEQ